MATVEASNDIQRLGRESRCAEVLLQAVRKYGVTLGAFLRGDGFDRRPKHLLIALRTGTYEVNDEVGTRHVGSAAAAISV